MGEKKKGKLTSYFSNGLPGISSHYGKSDYSNIIATLQKWRREEAGSAYMSWMDVPLDYMLTQILLLTKTLDYYNTIQFT